MPTPGDGSPTKIGFLDRRQTVALHGFNRWLVPPAALAIHLAIGEVYAFSVFKLPLTRVIGITESASTDWTQAQIGWVFSIAIVFLGLSAALFGIWLERVGPRRAMFTSAVCFCGGLFVSALGVAFHEIALLYLGYGVLGGIGLGIGYISPVSTLIKWFPDRPGMATGMAIMGFGGGAMIGSPLSHRLMDLFHTSTTVGVWESFTALGVLYFVFMMFGVVTIRLPASAANPPSQVKLEAGGTTPNAAIQTRSFWLLWAVLLLNVTAGIGVIEQASPMIQEMFPERVPAVAAAGFVGLLSLFNMAGRFIWSSLSDAVGRKPTYTVFFLLGAALYALTPLTGRLGSVALFVMGYGVILSMYGGGFATIPAYLRDQFGTSFVGAIHGRLLTAWSLAGVLGPVLVNSIRANQINSGVPKVEAYSATMDLMAVLLVVGFVCNLLIRRRVDAVPAKTPTPAATGQAPPPAILEPANPLVLALRWAWVGIPLLWGILQTALSSLALFR